MDRPALGAFGSRALLVDGLADHIPEPSERRVSDRHRDRRLRVDACAPARETVRRVHRNRADAIVAEMLLHLRDQRSRRAVWLGHLDGESAVDRGQPIGEDGVDDDALDLDDPAGVRGRFSVVGHDSPRAKGKARGRASRGRSLSKQAPCLSLDATGSGYPGRACGGVGHGWSSGCCRGRGDRCNRGSGARARGRRRVRRRRTSIRSWSSTRATGWSSHSGRLSKAQTLDEFLTRMDEAADDHRRHGRRPRRRWCSERPGGSAGAARRTAQAARRRHPGDRRPGACPGLRRHPARGHRVSTSRAGTRSMRSWPSSADRASR